MNQKNIKKTVNLPQTPLPTPQENTKMEEEKLPLVETYKPGRQKLKDIDNKKCKLVSIGFPKKVDNPVLHAKYQVEITYLDEFGKEHRKTIKFGEKTVNYYAENGDELSLKLLMSKLRNYDVWTKPSFYVYHLLCKKPDIREAYTSLLTAHANGNI